MGTLIEARFTAPLELRSAGGGDGLTVWGRIVPYGEVCIFEDPRDHRLRQERFHRGAIMGITSQNIHRIKLGMEHESGYVSNVGRMTDFDDQSDGAYATFKLYRQDAEKAWDHLETTHKGLSLEFYDLHKGRNVGGDGVVDRRSVTLDRVAAVPDPAYDGARVLALRERVATQGEEPPEPTEEERQADAALQQRSTPNRDKAAAILAEMERNRPGVLR